jgi:hypothetical protein
MRFRGVLRASDPKKLGLLLEHLARDPSIPRKR